MKTTIRSKSKRACVTTVWREAYDERGAYRGLEYVETRPLPRDEAEPLPLTRNRNPSLLRLGQL